MGFGFWNEAKYFITELLPINMDMSPSSLVPSQIFSIPFIAYPTDALETLQIISVLEGFIAEHHQPPQSWSYILSQHRTIKTPVM